MDPNRLLRNLTGLLEADEEPSQSKFDTADDAITWYNSWLTTLSAPDDPEGCRECSPEYGGWDPVIKWHTKDGQNVYWYVVGTAGSESLVIEGEDTIRGWGNQYYYYYAKVNGEEAADEITGKAGLPEKAPPDDLKPSTPESEYWASLI